MRILQRIGSQQFDAVYPVIAPDLKDLTLVDRDAVRFLKSCEAGGITLKNCPAYIREWIARAGHGA